MMRASILWLGFAVALGCGPSIQFTRSNATPAAPKPPSCDFDVLATRPARPYVEIGIFDLTPGAIPALAVTSAGDLKDRIRGRACEMGTDAVITEVNGVGHYVRAIALRWTPAQAP